MLCLYVWGRRSVSWHLRLLLGAPLQLDRLLHRVRVDQLQHADLLWNCVAHLEVYEMRKSARTNVGVVTDLLGGEVGNQLGDEPAMALGLELAMLLRLSDR